MRVACPPGSGSRTRNDRQREVSSITGCSDDRRHIQSCPQTSLLVPDQPDPVGRAADILPGRRTLQVDAGLVEPDAIDRCSDRQAHQFGWQSGNALESIRSDQIWWNHLHVVLATNLRRPGHRSDHGRLVFAWSGVRVMGDGSAHERQRSRTPPDRRSPRRTCPTQPCRPRRRQRLSRLPRRSPAPPANRC